jgi:hypothetical protein
MIDLEYDPTSFAGPIDWRVVRFIESYRKHKFDSSYLDHVEKFHGGIPGKQYFTAVNGATFRVGRFLTLVDEETDLQPPFRQSWEFPERDIRIHWSVLTRIDEDGPISRELFAGEVLWPFAALYWGPHHPDEMGTEEGGIVDHLCFHYVSDEKRPSVIVSLAQQAQQEVFRRELGRRYDAVRYADFTVPVAPHFDAFLELLRRQP